MAGTEILTAEAGTEILTAEEAADFVPGTRGGRAAILELYRQAVSDCIDDLCGPVVIRQVTEVHDAGTRIILRYPPVDGEVTSITTRSGLDTETVDLTEVVIDPAGFIDRPWSSFGDGPSSVTVVYDAGRFETTEDVTSRFKIAAGALLRAWWRPAEGGGSQTFGDTIPGFPTQDVPPEVLNMLRGELAAPVVA
jgi:hypothetical protein